MYLAQKYIDGQTCYVIRESYPHEDYFLSRDLFDLGPDPGRYIIYPGGNSFYIDEIIENKIIDLGRQVDPDQLEDIFWRFLDPEIARVLEPFRSREKRHRAHRKKRRSSATRQDGVHMFDKRRIHFLRFGDMDQRNIVRLPQKLFRKLLDKSRDEIEQMFMGMERELDVREYKTYVYVIFDLQQCFHESYARSTPRMLSPDKVDTHFIDQVCRLNTDTLLWADMLSANRLNGYLTRYVWMYFDYDYAAGSLMDEYLRQFINSRREYRPPHRNKTVILKAASTIFGRAREELEKMSPKELTRLYRQRAQEMHPDKGGDQDIFVKLSEAYHELLQTKKD